MGDEQIGSLQNGELIDVGVGADARRQRPDLLRRNPPDRQDHAAARSGERGSGVAIEGGAHLEDRAQRDVDQLIRLTEPVQRRLGLDFGGTQGSQRTDVANVLAAQGVGAHLQ